MTQINKKFITFDTKARFVGSDGINNTALTQEASNGYVGNIPYNSVVFIKDTGLIWTHGRYFCELTDGSGISVGHIYFVNGTQTKATNLWTGDLPFGVTEYYNGLTICYRLPYNGTSGAATLQLGNLAACNVKKNYSESISNHYKGGSIIRLTYYDGIWQTVDYDSNTYDRTISSGYLVAGSQVLANSLVRIGVDGKAYLLANNNSSNTTAMVASRTYSTTPCQFGLLYYYSGGLISAGSNLTTSRLYEQVPFDLRNSDNCLSSAYNASTNTMSLQVGKPVYIRVEISDYGWYPVEQTATGIYGGSSTYSRCWTQTEFIKGANYIYVGIAYNNYSVFLSAKNEMYYAYDTNKLQSIEYNHTHKIKINNNEKIINPTTDTTVDLGNYAVNNYLTSDNLNNVITPGFYNSGGGNKCTNKPGDVSAFGLIVVHDADGDYYTQILFDGEVSDKSYIRHCNNGTWTSWSEMKFTDTWRLISVNNTNIEANALNIKSGTNINVNNDGSGNVSISGNYSAATSSASGLMSSTDKANLDNMSNHYVYLTAWKSTIKCATWSRLCLVGCGVSIEGNSFLLNVRGTRSNVVYNNTFAINAHHRQNGSIVKIVGSRYGSSIQVRIVVDSSGNCYVELYDDANKATSATTQNVNCTFIRVTSGDLTSYTAFTDGTTLPSNYAIAASLTTNKNNLLGNLDWAEITGKPTAFDPTTHTHATSIATTTDTSNITLSPDTKYKLTSGDTSTVFTTAPNTWRKVSVESTSIGSNALTLKGSTNILLNNSNGTVTVEATGLASSEHTHYVGKSEVQLSKNNLFLTGVMLTGIDNTVDHALLQSGSSRADNATGDTWIFWDSKGGSSTPWGIKHNLASNFIEFYGKGVRRGYIDINDNTNVFNGSADKVDGIDISFEDNKDNPTYLAFCDVENKIIKKISYENVAVGQSLGTGRDTYISAPGDATYVSLATTQTGYLIIKLPVLATNTMMSFFVDVYNYSTGNSITYKIAGYNYNSNTCTWHNCTATPIGSVNSYSGLKCRFGYSGEKAAISIGESTTTWSYPQVVVRDVLIGYSNYTKDKFYSGWNIVFSTTAITESYGNGSAITMSIKANEADTLDGFHANGLLTEIKNSNKGISITVGKTTKSVSNINVDMLDGYHIHHIAKAYNASGVSLDTVAKSYGSFFGMVTPAGNSVDTYIKTYPINSSSWFHVFLSSWNNQNNGNDDTTNYWITLIVNPAGYNTPYIRSRKGGDDIATNWTSWARILTSEDDLNGYHNHGTLNGTFTQTLANTTTDNGWNMIEPNYYKSTTATDGTVTISNKIGFILKSIRGESSSPNWFLGDYSAGIAFGGGDTKGVISLKYSSPSIRFAGGNTSKPVWYMTITGENKVSYALNTISSNASTGATHAGKSHSFTIADTLVSALGGSISAATIGNALTSDAPAAYASDADKIDGLHASSFVRQWDGVYGYANKVCTLTRSDEKGWMILKVCTSSNGSSGSFGIYRIAWEYKSTSVTEKPITITCLCTNLNVYATALTAVRIATGTHSNTFDLYFKFDSAAVFAGYTERHSSSTTIDYSVCEAVEVSAIPTATYTSLMSNVYLNTTGNADTATIAKTAQKWTTPIALKIGNKSFNLDGSSGLTYTLADIGFQNTWRDIKINNASINLNTLNLIDGTNIALSNTDGKVSVGISGTVKKAATLEIDTSDYSSTADSCMPADADVFSVYRCENDSGAPGKDGNVLSMSWANSSGKYGSLIYVDTDSTGIMALRLRNGSGVWSDWCTVLHSGNYNSYTPIINSASTHATSSTKIIAPTSTGNTGQIVTADSNGYAQWSSPSSLDKVGDADTVDNYHADLLRRGSWNGLLINDVLNISPKTNSKTITIKTTIQFVNSAYMPSIYIKGYAYGMSVPVNLHLVFYVYDSAFVNYSVINTGGWTPKIYLSTYTVDSTKYIAITLIDSAKAGLYFPTLHVDYANPHGTNIYYSNWTYSSSTSETVPTSDVVQLSYKSITSNISGNAATASYASNIGTSNIFLSYTDIKTVYDWYNTVNKTDNTDKIIDTWSEIVKFVEDFNTDTDLANEFLKYLPKSGGDMTGSITFKDVDGIKMASNNKDVSIWSVWSAESSEGNYGFRLCYAGTGSGDNNILKLIADNQTGTEVAAMSMTQSGATTWDKSLTVSNGDISAANGNVTGANVWKIISITKNLKVTTEWADTGIVLNKDTFTTGQGTYAIQLMATSISNSTDLWPAIYSGICTIYIYSTNNGTESDEIELHSGGHATKKRLYLRTICGASNTYAKLQIASNTNMSSSYDYIFKFKRLI